MTELSAGIPNNVILNGNAARRRLVPQCRHFKASVYDEIGHALSSEFRFDPTGIFTKSCVEPIFIRKMSAQ